jgi:hypothetical protein
MVLAATGSAALLLRGRLFPTGAQRIPLLVSGLAGLALLGLGAIRSAPAGTPRLLYLVAVILVAALVLAAGLVYSRRSPSPYLGRIADIVDVLAIMALIPLAAAAIGVFHAIQGLFASIGS